MEPMGTRERLLAATIETIDRGGEQAVRVREVAAAVGVAEPSIYHFFGSREALLDEAQASRYERTRGALHEDFRSASRRCTSADEFFALVRASLAQYCQPERSWARAVRTEILGLAQSRPSLAARVVAEQRAAMRLTSDGFAFAQRKGWVRYDLDPEALSVWIAGQVNSRLLVEIDPDRVDGAAWNRAFVDAVMAVLVAPEEPSDGG